MPSSKAIESEKIDDVGVASRWPFVAKYDWQCNYFRRREVDARQSESNGHVFNTSAEVTRPTSTPTIESFRKQRTISAVAATAM
ncbi:hypothetical protein Aduo_016535 [Ancylostoma duodenale]